MLSRLVLMVGAFLLGIYVANVHQVKLFEVKHSTTQVIEKARS